MTRVVIINCSATGASGKAAARVTGKSLGPGRQRASPESPVLLLVELGWTPNLAESPGHHQKTAVTYPGAPAETH